MSRAASAAQGSAPTWLSTKEAADQLGIVVRTLYGFVNRGELTAYRLGRVVRIRVCDLEAFLEAQRIRPGGLDHLLGEDEGHQSDNGSD